MLSQNSKKIVYVLITLLTAGYYNVANFEIQRKPNQELINSTMRISLPGMYGFKGSPKNIHETNGTIQIRNDSTDESDIANCQVWKNIGKSISFLTLVYIRKINRKAKAF